MVLTEDCDSPAAAVEWVRAKSGAAAAQLPVLFACDIGATNARMCLSTVPAPGQPVTVCAQYKRKANSKAALLAELRGLAAELTRLGCVVVGSALCCPGPRDAAATQLGPIANYRADRREDRIIYKRELPESVFPPAHSRILNDLEAGAYGIVALGDSGGMETRFAKMWGPRPVGLSLGDGPYLVLAAGTGLGTGLVYRGAGATGAQDGAPVVMPLEFGHTSAYTMDAADAGFLEYVKGRVQLGDKPPEYDALCSGRGLLWAWEHASRKGSGLPKLSDPGEVAKRALGTPPCPYAREAMFFHYKCLMGLASDLSMGFVLGGVILAGDNVRLNGKFLEEPEVCERLRQACHSHTTERMGYQSRVTVLRQTSPHNLNLEGSFYMAAKLRGPPPATAKL